MTNKSFKFTSSLSIILLTILSTACFDPNIIPFEQEDLQNSNNQNGVQNDTKKTPVEEVKPEKPKKPEKPEKPEKPKKPADTETPEEGDHTETVAKVAAYQPTWSGLNPPQECGNGTVDIKEECDDGNLNNGDGCDSNCQLEANTVCSTDREYITDSNVLLRIKGYKNANDLNIPCMNRKDVVSKYLNEEGYPFITTETCTGYQAEANVEKFSKIFTNPNVPTINDLYFKRNTPHPISYSDISSDDDFNPFKGWYSEKSNGSFNPMNFDPAKINTVDSYPFYTISARMRIRYSNITNNVQFAAKGTLYVYVNNILAIDQATPQETVHTLNLIGQTDPTTHKYVNKQYNLEEGGVYEISMFYIHKTPLVKGGLLIAPPHNMVGPSICQKCGDGKIFSIGGDEGDEQCDYENTSDQICDDHCRLKNGYKCRKDYDHHPICYK